MELLACVGLTNRMDNYPSQLSGGQQQRVMDRPEQFVLPRLMNLHNHCFSEAVARTHTEDGAGRESNDNIVYSVLLPLSKRGIALLTPQRRLDAVRLGILQLLKGGSATVMEPVRAGQPEMFTAADQMGIHLYGAPYLFSSSDPKTDAQGVVQYGAGPGVDLDRWNMLHAEWYGRDAHEQHNHKLAELQGRFLTRSKASPTYGKPNFGCWQVSPPAIRPQRRNKI